MTVCRYCHTEIREATSEELDRVGILWINLSGMYSCPTHPETVAEELDRVGILWIHLSGMYSCPTHPETVAVPFDSRWDSVYGAITNDKGWPDTNRFGLELEIDGRFITSTFRASTMELADAESDLYSYILDNMVNDVDRTLADAGYPAPKLELIK